MEQQQLEKVKVAIYLTALLSGGVYAYFNYFWKPNVSVTSVDYTKGQAQITINGIEQTLYSGSTLSLGHGWGIKFSPHQNMISRSGKSKAKIQPYRVELVKDHLAMSYLDVEKTA